MNDVNEQFLIEREKIRATATKGPWFHREHDGEDENGEAWVAATGVIVNEEGYEIADTCFESSKSDPIGYDAECIVDAVNKQPILIAEIRRFRAFFAALVAIDSLPNKVGRLDVEELAQELAEAAGRDSYNDVDYQNAIISASAEADKEFEES